MRQGHREGFANGKTGRALEDETNIAEAIRFLLGREGWRVETLANVARLSGHPHAVPIWCVDVIACPGKAVSKFLRSYARTRAWDCLF